MTLGEFFNVKGGEWEKEILDEKEKYSSVEKPHSSRIKQGIIGGFFVV